VQASCMGSNPARLQSLRKERAECVVVVEEESSWSGVVGTIVGASPLTTEGANTARITMYATSIREREAD